MNSLVSNCIHPVVLALKTGTVDCRSGEASECESSRRAWWRKIHHVGSCSPGVQAEYFPDTRSSGVTVGQLASGTSWAVTCSPKRGGQSEARNFTYSERVPNHAEIQVHRRADRLRLEAVRARGPRAGRISKV